MRTVPLAGAAAALVLGVAGAVAVSAASQAAGPSPVKSQTLVFKVVFSPFELVQANNVRNPNSPFALGDEVVFHDQLFAHGQHVGDDVGDCVIVDLTPELPNNCSSVIRLPSGNITTQFSTSPGPAPKPLALTGGTGIYRNIGGDGTLVEFGSVHGKLTLHVLSLVARGG
jgi:Allene oxide cyclase barrel like domain